MSPTCTIMSNGNIIIFLITKLESWPSKILSIARAIYSPVLFPSMVITHFEFLLISLVLNGLTLTATLTEADMLYCLMSQE